MTIKEILSVISGILIFVAFIPYIRGIVRREIEPKKATWIIWASCDIILVIGMLVKNSISGLVVTSALGASTTFLLLLKYGKPGWTRLEKVCMSLATLAIGLWKYFRDSNVGIALSCTALVVAAWPTLLSAWKEPESEDRKAWAIFEASTILGVLAIPNMTFASVVPPITFLVIDTSIFCLVFLRPYFLRKWADKTLLD